LAVPALVVLIGFVLLGVVWWVVKSVGGPEGDKPKRGAQPVVIAPEVSRETVVDEPAGDGGNAGAPNSAAPGGTSSGNGARSRDANAPRVVANGGVGGAASATGGAARAAA